MVAAFVSDRQAEEKSAIGTVKTQRKGSGRQRQEQLLLTHWSRSARALVAQSDGCTARRRVARKTSSEKNTRRRSPECIDEDAKRSSPIYFERVAPRRPWCTTCSAMVQRHCAEALAQRQWRRGNGAEALAQRQWRRGNGAAQAFRNACAGGLARARTQSARAKAGSIWGHFCSGQSTFGT